jgi:hypothetical protein
MTQAQRSEDLSKPLGTIWLDWDPHSVVTVGLKRTLEERAHKKQLCYKA